MKTYGPYPRAIGEMDQEFMFSYVLHAVNIHSKV